MIDHSKCGHPSTPSARSKCRRANGATPRTRGATPRVLNLRDDEEKRPSEKSRCCYQCGIRQIEWEGTIPLTNQHTFTCDKCKYLIVNADDLKPKEV